MPLIRANSGPMSDAPAIVASATQINTVDISAVLLDVRTSMAGIVVIIIPTFMPYNKRRGSDLLWKDRVARVTTLMQFMSHGSVQKYKKSLSISTPRSVGVEVLKIVIMYNSDITLTK